MCRLPSVEDRADDLRREEAQLQDAREVGRVDASILRQSGDGGTIAAHDHLAESVGLAGKATGCGPATTGCPRHRQGAASPCRLV